MGMRRSQPSEGVPPQNDDRDEEAPYTPSQPAKVPGMCTVSAVTVYTSLPSDSPEPEEWQLEYGFRYTGGWKAAPWIGQVEESIPRQKGRGKVWVCAIEGLEADARYIVRVRAKAPRGQFFNAGVVGWGAWSETSAVIVTPPFAAAVAAATGFAVAVEPEGPSSGETAAGLLTAAGAFLQAKAENAAARAAAAAAEPEPEPELEPEPEPELKNGGVTITLQPYAKTAATPRLKPLEPGLSPPRSSGWVKSVGGLGIATWPERFIAVEYGAGTSNALMGLHVWQRDGAGREPSYSVEDLRGCSIEKGSEHWVGRGKFPKLTVSGGPLATQDVSKQAISTTTRFSGIPLTDCLCFQDPELTFTFKGEPQRDRFYIACRNLALGRLWNDDGSTSKPRLTQAKRATTGSRFRSDSGGALAPRDELIAIYTQHNPRKVAQVDQLLAGWRIQPGGVPEMLVKVREKYLTEKPAPVSMFRGAISDEISEWQPVVAQWAKSYDGPLGIKIEADLSIGAMSPNALSGQPQLEVGMALMRVAGDSVEGYTKDQAVAAIKAAGKPLTLVFRSGAKHAPEPEPELEPEPEPEPETMPETEPEPQLEPNPEPKPQTAGATLASLLAREVQRDGGKSYAKATKVSAASPVKTQQVKQDNYSALEARYSIGSDVDAVELVAHEPATVAVPEPELAVRPRADSELTAWLRDNTAPAAPDPELQSADSSTETSPEPAPEPESKSAASAEEETTEERKNRVRLEKAAKVRAAKLKRDAEKQKTKKLEPELALPRPRPIETPPPAADASAEFEASSGFGASSTLLSAVGVQLKEKVADIKREVEVVVAEPEAEPADEADDEVEPELQPQPQPQPQLELELEQELEPEPEPEPEPEVPYVPFTPVRVPGTVTPTAVTIYTSLPSDSPEPEEWELEYGFRYTGGWKPAVWQGRVDEKIPKEKDGGPVWVCRIESLQGDSKYIVRVRAKAPDMHVSGGVRPGGLGAWSQTSAVIVTPPDPNAHVVLDRKNVTAEGETGADAADTQVVAVSSYFSDLARKAKDKIEQAKEQRADAVVTAEVEAAEAAAAEAAAADAAAAAAAATAESLGSVEGDGVGVEPEVDLAPAVLSVAGALLQEKVAEVKRDVAARAETAAAETAAADATAAYVTSADAAVEEEPEAEPEPLVVYTSKPTEVPGTITTASFSICITLPQDAPDPEEWEIEYGYRCAILC